MTLQELHLQMQQAIRTHAITTISCDPPASFCKFYERRIQFVPAYWLNEYHNLWDALEDLGLQLQVVIPATPHFPSDQALRWSEHNGFEEPKREVSPFTGRPALPPPGQRPGLGGLFK